jgi:hypothetical protein
MIYEENPQSAIADLAHTDKRSLMLRAAQSVLDEMATGRNVDPHRIEWATAVQSIMAANPIDKHKQEQKT